MNAIVAGTGSSIDKHLVRALALDQRVAKVTVVSGPDSGEQPAAAHVLTPRQIAERYEMSDLHEDQLQPACTKISHRFVKWDTDGPAPQPFQGQQVAFCTVQGSALTTAARWLDLAGVNRAAFASIPSLQPWWRRLTRGAEGKVTSEDKAVTIAARALAEPHRRATIVRLAPQPSKGLTAEHDHPRVVAKAMVQACLGAVPPRAVLQGDDIVKTAQVYDDETRQLTAPREADREHSEFVEDDSIPALYRATLAQYKGSGYDRGHLMPAADVRHSQECTAVTRK